MSKKILQLAAVALVTMSAILPFSTSTAGEADVLDVQIKALGDNRYKIDVTVEHADAGWDHYANKWEVLTVDGELLGTRVLAHPHDNEQPFTRSLTLNIPEGTVEVVIRAGDSVHEEGGKEMTVAVPQA